MTRWLALALLFPPLALAAPVQVQGVRLWAAPDNTRIVFDIDGPAEHSVFALRDPDRLVVDLASAQLAADIPDTSASPLLRAIRHAPRSDSGLRVVFDLSGPVRPKSFLLRPNERYGHRLVIDLYDATASAAQPRVRSARPAVEQGPREVLVAIDAGHGGEDPGALGRRGTREKDVVLQIARRLERLVKAEYGMKPLLVRDGDYFVGLQDRYEKARSPHQADLFISIHADAFDDHRARGSSVYVLSDKGASTAAAAFLAEQENASDRIGGVSLEDKDDLLRTVLLDLSQSATIEDSLEVAGDVHSALRRVGRMHARSVQQAGFVVLKSPDVPSILVETGFITNPAEERNLRDPAHQSRVAQAIMDGVRAYFRRKPPPGTLLASTQHIIRKGDTLSGIARRYSVPLQRLREANGLDTDRLSVGAVLRIPNQVLTLAN